MSNALLWVSAVYCISKAIFQDTPDAKQKINLPKFSDWDEFTDFILPKLCDVYSNNQHIAFERMKSLEIVHLKGASLERLTQVLMDDDSRVNIVMLNTLYSIGKDLREWDGETGSYTCREVYSDNCERFSHAYLLDNFHGRRIVAVIPSGCATYDSRRKVSRLLPIILDSSSVDDDSLGYGLVRIKARDFKYNSILEDECDLLEQLYSSQNSSSEQSRFLIDPVLFRFIWGEAKNRRTIFIQRSYRYSGNDLLSLTLPHITHVFWSLTSGLDYVHNNGKVHADVRPKNFAIESDSCDPQKKPIAKLRGFDFSTEKSLPFGAFPSPEMMEDLLKDIYSKAKKDPKLDSFGVGMTLFLLFCNLDEPVSYLERRSWVLRRSEWGDLGHKYESHKTRGFFERKVNDKWVYSYSKWSLLNMYIYENGVDEYIKKLLIDTMTKHIDTLHRFSSDDKAKIIEMFDIGFKLLEKDPEKRISCAEASVLFGQLEEKWTT